MDNISSLFYDIKIEVYNKDNQPYFENRKQSLGDALSFFVDQHKKYKIQHMCVRRQRTADSSGVHSV
jgi:hypothetical protein